MDGRKDHIKRAGQRSGIYLVHGKWRRERKVVDYVLRLQIGDAIERVAGLIEAKKNTLPLNHGLEQAKQYADAKRLNVPFVFTSNGYQFVEYDVTTG
ncbi:MAG: type I restriction enzyme HsdR N-terminal domain-containing protein [Caldilineaceae bacterium]